MPSSVPCHYFCFVLYSCLHEDTCPLLQIHIFSPVLCTLSHQENVGYLVYATKPYHVRLLKKPVTRGKGPTISYPNSTTSSLWPDHMDSEPAEPCQNYNVQLLYGNKVQEVQLARRLGCFLLSIELMIVCMHHMWSYRKISTPATHRCSSASFIAADSTSTGWLAEQRKRFVFRWQNQQRSLIGFMTRMFGTCLRQSLSACKYCFA